MGVLTDFTMILRPDCGLDPDMDGLLGGVRLFNDALSPAEAEDDKEPTVLTEVGLVDLNVMEVVTTDPTLVVFFLMASGLLFWPEVALLDTAFVVSDFDVGVSLSFLLLRGLEKPALTLRGLAFDGSTVAPPLRCVTGLDFGETSAAVLALRGEVGLSFDAPPMPAVLLDDRGLDFGDPLAAALVFRGETGLEFGERLLTALVLRGNWFKLGELPALVLRGERGLGFRADVDADFTPFELKALPVTFFSFFFPATPDETFFFLALRDGELRLEALLIPAESTKDFTVFGITDVLELDRRFPPVKSPLGPITVRVGAETLVRSSSSS